MGEVLCPPMRKGECFGRRSRYGRGRRGGTCAVRAADHPLFLPHPTPAGAVAGVHRRLLFTYAHPPPPWTPLATSQGLGSGTELN